MVTACLGTRWSIAQGPVNPREYKVKAAYIYNFTRYVTWPKAAFTNAQAPFVIAVVGNDPFGKSLDALRKRKVANRPIVIKRFASMRDYKSSHVLFLSFQTTPSQRSEALRKTKGKSVLVVGESPKFAGMGAALNFFPDGNGTIGFELNVDAVKRCGMQVDAKLLSIARVVRDGG